MTKQQTHDSILKNTAEQYKKNGYEVFIAPQVNELPFDLGRYRPDLLVKKSKNEGYIIEVKDVSREAPIDHYREIAETVAQHAGWRFLLVTGEDSAIGNLLSWEQIFRKKEHVERLIASGEKEAAFLPLWTIFEALMRKQAERASIPIERFPTSSLIKHLYSQGELSIAQFDQAIALLNVRNRIVHGFEIIEVEESFKQLKQLVDELIHLWMPQAS
ncbi:hypothetical protein U14_00554 [Candidatus Moduliflexus flocculans]|uniref:REase AHJR-like domain-containing protein n=1 Tax=Candidatus Moduliflexus flocculans TaxID=1499966 RepID=A0A0S6VTN3_9BACT|nr:hypothetical protein U14_00554 [Candidatus Moduliflexus flocculans]